MPRFAKADEIAPNFFRGLNWQRVTRIIFEGVEQNSDYFAFEIQEGSAALSALRRQICSQMFSRKVSTTTVAIETGDHAKAWGFRESQRMTNRNERSGDL